MAKPIVSAARLHEVLNYDPDTGIFTWRVKPSTNVLAGSSAGHLKRGYVFIGIDGSTYFAHRLVWLHVHGAWPTKDIDHINGLGRDNRLCNLRAVTKSVNQQNRRGPQKNNTSGYLGVSWVEDRRNWLAQIHINGIVRNLGRFATAELAYAAYITAKRAIHEGCTI